MSSLERVHDFQNQLGIILGFVELLIADMEEGDRRIDDLIEIRTATQRALDLVPEVGRELCAAGVRAPTKSKKHTEA